MALRMAMMLRKKKVLLGSLLVASLIWIRFLQGNRWMMSSNNNMFSSNSSPPQKGPIPHILWFTYQHNILETKTPKLYYDNVMKTIRAYRAEWNEEAAPVYFLDNDNCTTLLQEVDRQLFVETTKMTLTKLFWQEERGDIKADLCRLAALYLYGGYYFDVDIEVVQPVRLDSTISFCSAKDSIRYILQAFMASTPYHPLLKANLYIFMDVYKRQKGHCWVKRRHLLGPCTLAIAWKQASRHYSSSLLLTETHLQRLPPPTTSSHQFDYLKNVTQRGNGDSCHWVVHDPTKQQVYFYSRIIGSPKCPAAENL